MAEDAYDFAKSVNDQAINSSNVVLRTLIIIHGGAAVALLAFIGNLVGNKSLPLTGKFGVLTEPFMWFGWGIVITVVAMTFAYFTNYATVENAFAAHGGDEKVMNRSACWKTVFHILAVIAAIASVVLFVIGLYAVRCAILTVLR